MDPRGHRLPAPYAHEEALLSLIVHNPESGNKFLEMLRNLEGGEALGDDVRAAGGADETQNAYRKILAVYDQLKYEQQRRVIGRAMTSAPKGALFEIVLGSYTNVV